MSMHTPVTDVDERQVASRSPSTSERTSGQVSRPDTGNSGGVMDGYQRGYTRPVTSVDADHDDGWHRTADGSWTQHEIGHGPTPRPESTAMGRLAQAGRTGGAGAENVGRAGLGFFKGVRKRFSKLGKALDGAKKADQVNDSVDTAQGNIEDANNRASGHVRGVAAGSGLLGQTVLGVWCCRVRSRRIRVRRNAGFGKCQTRGKGGRTGLSIAGNYWQKGEGIFNRSSWSVRCAGSCDVPKFRARLARY